MAPVHFARGLDQQIGQSRMQVPLRDELDGGRDQRKRFQRHIAAQVERPRRQFQLAEVTETPHVGFPLHEIEEPDAARVQQLAHAGRRGGIPHQERAVDLALEQGLHRVIPFEVEQFGRAIRFDTVGLEQGQGHNARSAALAADRDAPALQFGQPLERRAAVEHRERFVKHAPERYQIADVHQIGQPALDESDVNVGIQIAQALQVVERAFGRQNLERHVVAREYLAILLGVGPKRSALRTARNRHGVRRRGSYEMKRDPDRDAAQQQHQAQRRREVAPRNVLDPQRPDLALVVVFGHRNALSPPFYKNAGCRRRRPSNACK